MSDTLLAYFNRELDALRVLASEFAERHPKIASRLRLTKDAVDAIQARFQVKEAA